MTIRSHLRAGAILREDEVLAPMDYDRKRR